MSAPRVTVNVHLDADTPVERATFPRSEYPPFVAVSVGVAGDQRVALMTSDPAALTALADIIAAAHADLVAVLGDRAATAA